jgi:hypothetical protein
VSPEHSKRARGARAVCCEARSIGVASNDVTNEPSPEHQALADELTQVRETLIELARRLPESRAYRATSRAGWTLKHELAALGAADDELIHVLDEVKRRTAPIGLDLRRRRGETMHRLQQLRLTPLLDEVEQGGTRAIEALRAQGQHLDEGAWIEGATHAAAATPHDLERRGRDLLQAYGKRAREALETIRAAVEG